MSVEKSEGEFGFVNDDGSIYSVELIDLDRLNIVLGNQEHFKLLVKAEATTEEKDITFGGLYNYRKIYSNGKFLFKYTQNNSKGRRYVRDTLSLQTMPRALRATLAHNHYIDLDMVNAHPTILNHIAKTKLKMNCKYLREYIDKREEVIESILEENHSETRNSIKQIILTIINGGECKCKQNKWLTGFIAEMERVRNKAVKVFPQRYQEVCRARDYNTTGSLINHLMCDLEDKILMQSIDFLFENDVVNAKTRQGTIYIDAVLCFDGLMIRKDNIEDRDINKIIEDLEAHIYEQMGVSIKYKVKPLEPIQDQLFCRANTTKKDQQTSKTDVPIRYFDSSDEYYWMDFMNEILNRSPPMYDHELELFCMQNINRVCLQLITGDLFIKKDKNDLFCPVKSLDNRKITYLVPGKGKRDDIQVSQVFRTYYQEELTNPIKVYNNLILKPLPNHDDVISSNLVNRDFNIWTGFKAELLPQETVDFSKIEMIMNHIKTVWAFEDDVKFKYICSWFHNIFKYPYQKTKVAMVFYSEDQQIGKSIIMEQFLRPFVFGPKLCTCENGLGFATERFNEHLMSKLLVSCEELNSLDGNFHATFDSMKKLITNRTIKIEIKGGRKFEIDDFMNFILFTNHQFSIKVEKSDARYFITECNPIYRMNFEYFKQISQCFSQESANHFYSYLYWMEDPVEIRNIPETALKKEIKISCMSSTMKFLYRTHETLSNFKDKGTEELDGLNEWQRRVLEKQLWPSNELYSLYRSFCRDENEKEATQTKFGREIGNFVEKRRSNGSKYDLLTIKTS